MDVRSIVASLLLTVLVGTAMATGWQAEMDRSQRLLEQGRYAEAEAAARAALETAQGAYGPASREAARVLRQLGAIATWRHNHQRAEAVTSRALRIMERHYGPAHPVLPDYLDSLALTLSRQRKYDAAEPLYQRSLAIREATQGGDHPAAARTLALLAADYRRRHKFAEAESLGRRVLDIRRKRLGPDHETVGDALFFLATLEEMQGKTEGAETWYRAALARNERRWGPDSPRTASMAKRLADVLREAGKFDEAEALYRRALAIWEAELGPEHRQTGMVRHRLESLQARRETTPRREVSAGEGTGRLTRARWKERMGRVKSLREAGEKGQALGVAEAAVRDAAAARGRHHPWVAEALILAARCRTELGDPNGAETAFRRALTILETAHGADSIEASLVLDDLAAVYRDREQFPQAIALRERALAIWEGQFGADHPTVQSRRERLERLRAEARQAAPVSTTARSKAATPSPDVTGGGNGRGPSRPRVSNPWEQLRRGLQKTRDAAAKKVATWKESLGFAGVAEAWDTHVGFLVRKFSWREWAWILLGTGFLVFLLLKDWN